MLIKSLLLTLLIVIIQISCNSQPDNLSTEIAAIRKGKIIIQAPPGALVEIEQLSHEFWFGSAISNGLAGTNWSENDKTIYKEIFLENFNSAVTENAVKWLSMEREKGNVNYSFVDGILAWTEQHHIPLRGHNIFWGIEKFVQPWLMDMDDQSLELTLKQRALSLASQYRGRFAEYDLNNEMIHGNFYADRLGNDITLKMAKWVHEADPDAKLWVNDYDILTGKKLDAYITHIRDLLAQGVPIAGIGVQGHLHSESFDPVELKRSLDSLATFNLPIRITEFNIPGQRTNYVGNSQLKLTPEQELEKADNLVNYYRICFAHPNVTGILQWGFWEGATWIPASAMYRRDWSETAALRAYQNLIFNEWWTNTSGYVDTDGKVEIPAFFGKYKISVNGKNKKVIFSKKDKEIVLDFR